MSKIYVVTKTCLGDWDSRPDFMTVGAATSREEAEKILKKELEDDLDDEIDDIYQNDYNDFTIEEGEDGYLSLCWRDDFDTYYEIYPTTLN